MAADRAEMKLPSIGSYLMLFDLNADETVSRAEAVKALREYFTDIQSAEPSSERKPSLR